MIYRVEGKTTFELLIQAPSELAARQLVEDNLVLDRDAFMKRVLESSKPLDECKVHDFLDEGTFVDEIEEDE